MAWSRLSMPKEGEVSPSEMHAIAARMKAQHLSRYVGATRPVLWEGPGRGGDNGQARWLGYTDHYLRVETNAPAHLDLENRITPARLDRLNPEQTGLLASIPSSPPQP